MRSVRGGEVRGGGGGGVYELLGWVVLWGYGREQCTFVHELLGRRVLGGDGREQCEYLCLVPGGFVLVRARRDQREHVCRMPGGGVLVGGGERVCIMPGLVLFHARIHIDHKLRLQRRVLRPERRRVHSLCLFFHIFAGQSDGDRLWMRRERIYNYYSNSEHTMEMWSWSKSSMYCFSLSVNIRPIQRCLLFG